MKQIVNSASRLVLMMFAVTLNIAFLYQVATQKVTPQDIPYKEAVLMAMTYYFTRDKGDKPYVVAKSEAKDSNPIE